ncbi:MAG: DinB family protein [Thermomicrobiales bacterium]
MADFTSDVSRVQLEAWRERHNSAHSQIETNLLEQLTDDALRTSPFPNMASIAWHIWHIARCEDMAISTLIANRPQMLDEEDWFERLNVGRRDIGTAMTDEEVADFNIQINTTALRDYFRAVMGRTDDVVVQLPGEDWTQVIDDTIVDGALRDHVLDVEARQWVGSFWKGTTKTWILWWLAVGHHYLHYGEALVTRDILARRGTQ